MLGEEDCGKFSAENDENGRQFCFGKNTKNWRKFCFGKNTKNWRKIRVAIEPQEIHTDFIVLLITIYTFAAQILSKSHLRCP